MNLLKSLPAFVVLTLVATSGAAAQERAITNEVVASAGGTASTSGMHLSWTIGEPIVTTLENNPVILTQGFHQPLDPLSLGTSAVRVLRAGEIAMYPNPARDHLTLALPADISAAALDIVSEKGVVVAHFDLVQRNTHIDCTVLPPGTYLARLSAPDSGDLIAALPLTVLR